MHQQKLIIMQELHRANVGKTATKQRNHFVLNSDWPIVTYLQLRESWSNNFFNQQMRKLMISILMFEFKLSRNRFSNRTNRMHEHYSTPWTQTHKHKISSKNVNKMHALQSRVIEFANQMEHSLEYLFVCFWIFDLNEIRMKKSCTVFGRLK